MEYLTSKQTATLWGISNRRVNTLCKTGRVFGAEKVGLMWRIPKNAKKPFDERKRTTNGAKVKYNNFIELQLKHELSLDKDYKKKNGIYYTPYKLVEMIYGDLNLPKNASILDPCCGMGSFLIAGIKAGFNHVYGVDNDYDTIRYLKTLIDTDNIFVHDSINNSTESTLTLLGVDKVDCVVGNPPYVPHGSIFGNLFIGSIIRSLDMLNKNGILSYVIPKNFLHVSTYSDLRKILLTQYQIVSIVDIGAYFKNVRGEQIVLTIRKATPTPNSKIIFKAIENDRFVEKVKIDQSVFNDIIRIYSSEYDHTIFKKLTKKFDTLGDFCNGNIARGKSKNIDAISGKEIKKFGFKSIDVPLEGDKIFLQNIYSVESGIIGSFAGNLEAKETVTVISIESSNFCKFLIAILHSRLINFFLNKYIYNSSKLTTHTDKKYLSNIPIIMPKKDKFNEIVDLVEKLQTTDYLSNEWYDMFELLNEKIYMVYMLDNNEINYIENYIKNIQSARWLKHE